MEATQGSMTTDIHPALTPNVLQSEAWQRVKGEPKGDPVPLPQPFDNTTHTVLQVQKPDSPGPESFSVNIFNGSKGVNFPVMVKSIDTIGKLQKKVQKLRPDLGSCRNLLYNGKPVRLRKTLSELQVKPGATFIIYQKCHGG